MKKTRGLRIVLDTNVLVAAVGRRRSAAKRLLQRVLKKELVLVASPAILAEYGEVLRRPELGLHEATVERVLRQVRRVARVVARRGAPVRLELVVDEEPARLVRRFAGRGTLERRGKKRVLVLELPDVGDLAFMAAALNGKANAIVTKNIRHFPEALRIPIRRPGALLAELDAAELEESD